MPITRRNILAAGAGLSASAAAIGLAACSPSGPAAPPGTTASEDAAAALPDYIAYDGPEPDFPGDGQDVYDAFTSYPTDRPAYATTPPGNGGTITGITRNLGAAMIPLDQNPYWQGINERLGVELALDTVPVSEYRAKFSTMLAGGELPDVMQIFADMPRLGELMEASFVDLTPFLAGDAIADYPALANLPTRSWGGAVRGGKLLAVPYAQQTTSTTVFVRRDVFEERDLPFAPTDGEEFGELCRALTDESRSQWAISVPPETLVNIFAQMLGAPNGWRDDNGALTSKWETDEFAVAIEKARALVAEGLAHPDMATMDSTTQIQSLGSGTIGMTSNAFTMWSVFNTRFGGSFPGVELYGLRLPKDAGGGLASMFGGTGYYTMTGITQAAGDDDRVKEILRVMDYLAAPFGTQENYYLRFGEEGVHHEIVDGEPQLIDAGTTQIQVPVQYVGIPAPVTYTPIGTIAGDMNAYQADVGPLQVYNPVATLYSPTKDKNAQIEVNIADQLSSIVLGREDMSTWAAAVDEWRAAGGDTIRAEYEAALAS